MKDYRNYEVWKKSHTLALKVYKATRPFPPEERYGLTSQLRRAAVSMAANIAEGSGRGSDRELGRFLSIAIGSANEAEYYCLLAKDLGLLKLQDHDDLTGALAEVRRMLSALARRVRGSAC